MHNLHRLLLLSSVLPVTAFALTLGEPSGQTIIGQPLAIRVRMSGTDASKVSADCVRISAIDGESSDTSLKSPSVRVENSSIIITTGRAVYEPILSFRLRVECGFQYGRDYQLLPSPPQPVIEAAAPTPPAAMPATEPRQIPEPAATAPQPTPEITATAPKPAPEVPLTITRALAQPPGSDYLVAEQTTLRLMSRKRYPLDSRARVKFIHRVAVANPTVFDSVKVAFDQPLTAGVQLRLPTNLPRQRSTAVPVSPGPVVKAAPREGARSAGKGRLIIGTSAPPNKAITELEADIGRLVKAMDDQIKIQASLTEHVKAMEEEVAKARQAATMTQSANQRLQSDIDNLRDEQTRNSYIQLVLAILLGGFAVAAFLLWRGQDRRPKMTSHPLF